MSERYALPATATDQLERLLTALAADPAPATTVTDPAAATDVHVADGLSGLEVEELRRATRIADLGAGAGFPGLALAVALPEAAVDLIEASARKCVTIERLGAAAGLANVRALPVRAEDLGRDGPAYDAVTARALAPLAVLVEYAAPLLEEDGVLVAWKGARDPVEERAGDTAAALVGVGPGEVRAVQPFPSARHRHLYAFTKQAPTPKRFPRRAGMARKRPLA